MYLVHFAVIFWLDKYLLFNYLKIPGAYKYLPVLNFGVRFIVILLVTIALSSITYKYIEKPFISLGKKIIKKREIQAIPSAD